MYDKKKVTKIEWSKLDGRTTVSKTERCEKKKKRFYLQKKKRKGRNKMRTVCVWPVLLTWHAACFRVNFCTIHSMYVKLYKQVHPHSDSHAINFEEKKKRKNMWEKLRENDFVISADLIMLWTGGVERSISISIISNWSKYVWEFMTGMVDGW